MSTSIPKFKVETLTPPATLDHTILGDVGMSLYYKDILTAGVGTFSFTVVNERAGEHEYWDVAENDIVKMYVGWDAHPVTPNFVGRVMRVVGPLKVENGYLRRISGLSQSEILQRRFLRDKEWASTAVDNIVEDIIDALQADDYLAHDHTKTAADATSISYEVETKSCFDILRDISDYWVDGSTKIQKDFFVDVNAVLNWTARPIRDSGVETLALGENILEYALTRDLLSVRNYVVVKGAKERTNPTDLDALTEEDCENVWTGLLGTAIDDTVGIERRGSECVRFQRTGAGNFIASAYYLFPSEFANYDQFVCWVWRASTNVSEKTVRILCPDTSNYFKATLETFPIGSGGFNLFNLGNKYVYDANKNRTPAEGGNGIWTKVGAASWKRMKGIWFYYDTGSETPVTMYVDGDVGFLFGYYQGTQSDPTSIAAYQTREHEQHSNDLTSDADCVKRALTVVKSRKDPPRQLELVLNGNANVLIGDRVPITIPAENIAANDYDVIITENFVTLDGWRTKATALNTIHQRRPLGDATQMPRTIGFLAQKLRDLGGRRGRLKIE